MKRKTKQVLWAILMILALVMYFATGCKPKEIITEKVVVKVDSTAITNLKRDITRKDSLAESLMAQLERTRDEITRLESETSSHTIIYDTTAQVIPETGRYPILQEIITSTKSQLDKTIKEMELQRQEYNRELNHLEQERSNLTLTVTELREENRDLKAKITPTTGFNFRLFFTGMGVGVVLMIALWLFLKFR